jgi:hypothetical protein
MNALGIFKQAGVANKLGFDLGQLGQSLQQGWNGISPYAKSGLIGAGLGGLGMGAASMLGGDNEHMGGNILKGMALGGAGGLGYQAVQNKWFNPDKGMTPELAQLKQRAAQKGEELDMHPFGYNHPISAGVKHYLDPKNSPISPTGAGAAGMGVNAILNQRAKGFLTSSSKEGKKYLPMADEGGPSIAGNISNLSQGTRQRVLEQLAKNKSITSNMDPSKLQDFVELSNFGGANKDVSRMTSKIMNELGAANGTFSRAGLRKQIDPNHMFGDSAIPALHRYIGNNRVGNWLTDKLMSGAQKLNASSLNNPNIGGKIHANALGRAAQRLGQSSMNPFSERTLEQSQIGAKMNNALGQMTGNPYAMRNLVRYGKYGGTAAATTYGAQHVGNRIADAITHMTTSPEQLEVWRQGGMR